MSQDVIYVGGGNTKSMLAIWREWVSTKSCSKRSTTGSVLAGISAGAICWFEYAFTDSFTGKLTGLPGSAI